MFWSTFEAIARRVMLEFVRGRGWVYLLLFQALDVGALAWLDASVRDMPVVVVDHDHTAESRALIERFEATNILKVKYLTTSTEQARGHIRAGRARVAIIVPADFGRARASGQPTQVLALMDGSDSSSSSQATSAIEEVSARIGAVDETISVDVRSFVMFNPTGSTRLFMLPALLVMLLVGGYGYAPLDIAMQRESGTLERLLMTPMSPVGWLLGTIAPHFVMAFLNALAFLAVMRFGFGVPIRGSLVALMLAITLYTIALLSLSSFIASSAKSYESAATTMLLVLLPTQLLSGYIFPISSIPSFLLPVSYAMPETHLIAISRGICLRASTIRDLAPHYVCLALEPIVLFLLALRRFRASLIEE